MLQPQHIAGPAAFREQRVNGVLDPMLTEVTEKGIARAQRQERQCWALLPERFGKKSVDDFVGSAVSADGNEFAPAAGVGCARNLGRISGLARAGHGYLDPSRVQSRQSRTEQLAALTASRRRIYNGQIVLPQGQYPCYLEAPSSR